jgi:hypothetical protein
VWEKEEESSQPAIPTNGNGKRIGRPRKVMTS